MTSAWLSLARVAPVDTVTTRPAAFAVSATKASPWTALAVAVKVKLGFGWGAGPGCGPEGLQADHPALTMSRRCERV